MARLPSKNFVFNPTILDQKKNEPRKILNLLPSVHQTETLQKFFSGSVDHLFQPGSEIQVNGYVGQKPSYYDPSNDFYINEVNSEREFYQLEPHMISKTIDNEIQNLLSYPDLINKLRFQGALVDNHSRLFDQPYYTWCPPIDLDKLMNFREYFWLPEGPEAIKIYGNKKKTIASGETNIFQLPIDDVFDTNQIRVFVDNQEVSFSYPYNNDYNFVELTSIPAKYSVVEVYTPSDFDSIIGSETFSFIESITLTSSLRIQILNDKNESLNGNTFIIEGVGDSIQLIKDNSPDYSLDPDYIVMERGSYDGNLWSIGNRWFHRDVVKNIDAQILKEAQAKRPIIEFEKNIVLFNYGSIRRPDIDLVCDNYSDFVSQIQGQQQAIDIDGVTISPDNMLNLFDNHLRILVTGDEHPNINNRIYNITSNNNRLQISLAIDGENNTGSPNMGDVLFVKLGQVYGKTELYWDGLQWNPAQTKNSINQAPLFQLYDKDGVELQNLGRYPQSTFQGNKLFNYSIDNNSTNVIDNILGMSIRYDNTGHPYFTNYKVVDRYSYEDGIISGYYYHKKITQDGEFLNNDWYYCDVSKQYVIDDYISDGKSKIFTISQIPDEGENNLIVERNGTILINGEDFIIQNNKILLIEVNENDFIKIKTFSSNRKIGSGYYEIPQNLQKNPNTLEVTDISKGGFFDQFSTIIKNQNGFAGKEFSSNNWRDTKRAKNLGKSIIQNSATLLKTMLFASSDSLDIMDSIRYSETEYARFKIRFEQKLYDYFKTGKYQAFQTSDQIVTLILTELFRGLTQDSPFYNSNMATYDDINTWIPSTPSYLGLYPTTIPEIIIKNGQNVIIGHDGSITPGYGDFRDQVLLSLEQRIYDSILEKFRKQERPIFDIIDWCSGKFRKAQYQLNEIHFLLRPNFERWCSSYDVDYKTNDTFDETNPFTWNWSSVYDKDGNEVPGHYQGIYQYYYDTYRPHTHPWEMLGFTNKPDWWDSRYGVQPYTRDNTLLWNDLEHGFIFNGSRKGINTKYARPGLSSVIPVDNQGKLLNPLEIGIIKNIPSPSSMRADWKWGDLGPVEQAWQRSYWYPFAINQISYLMKPSRFIEYGWDTENNSFININDSEQLINEKYNKRLTNIDEYVHGEVINNETIIRIGIQQWISDYLMSKAKDITLSLGNPIRGLNSHLAYKVGGFIDNNLEVITDTFGLVPSEDISTLLYKSPSIKEEAISGVILKWTGQYWKVYGFDILDQFFTVMPSDTNGSSITISTNVSNNVRIINWNPDTYYSINSTVRYLDSFYRCLKTHTSSRKFENEYWIEVARPEIYDTLSVQYFTEGQKSKLIEKIPYGNLLKTPQEVAEFICSYERYLKSRGWVFDILDEQSNILDWKLCVKDFLTWVKSKPNEGEFISLSPFKTKLKYRSSHGYIEPIEKIVNGVYSILNQTGQPIIPENTNILRDNDTVTIIPSNDELFSARLHVSENEHVLVFNNKTIFDNTIYDSLFGIKIPRIRIQGIKTKNWNGRISAPGFVITGSTLIPNFEKTANDFRNYFNLEGNSELQELARSNTGFSEKDYLTNLLMSPSNQFEFYQGMIQQKGTLTAFNRIMRSNYIRHNSNMKFLEEWAFRIGTYGADSVNQMLNVSIYQKDISNDPQLIRFTSGYQGGWDILRWDNDHWDYITRQDSVRVQYSLNSIKQVKILDSGNGYKSIPDVLVNGVIDNNLVPIINWTSSHITSVDILQGGTNYIEGDIVKFNGLGNGAIGVVNNVNYSGSKIIDIKINPNNGENSVGSGYSIGDLFLVVGGNNKAKARVEEIDENGGIKSLRIINQGNNYSSNSYCVSLGMNFSADQYLKPVISGGEILSISMLSGGYGYDNNTTAQLTGNGYGALFSVNISGGNIERILINNPTSGYTLPPVISLQGGDPINNASLEAIIESDNILSELKIMSFLKENAVILKSITINIQEAFNGTQPTIRIGDSLKKDRYVSPLNIGSIKKHIINFDNTPIYNSLNDINAYFSNISNKGKIEIEMEFEYSSKYFDDVSYDSSDDNILDVIDLFSFSDNEFLFKNNRWGWRYTDKELNWATQQYSIKEKGFLPNAGYVATTDVDNYISSYDEFLSSYRNGIQESPSEFIENNVKIIYSKTSKHLLIPSFSNGMSRFNKIKIKIDEDFPLIGNDTSTISIGTIEHPEKYISNNEINLNSIDEFEMYIFDFIDLNQPIYVFYNQPTQSIGKGSISITSTVEKFNSNIVPGTYTWVYNTGIKDWNVYSLRDTSLNIINTNPPSFIGQGTIVSVDKNILTTFNIEIDKVKNRLTNVIMDGVENIYSSLNSVYDVKLSNSRTIFLDNSSNSQTKLMDMFKDSGLIIDDITVSILNPFSNMGSPSLSIGTLSEPNKFVKSVDNSNVISNTPPSRPVFDYNLPITLNVYDEEQTLSEPSSTDNIDIRIIRNGNIFATPSRIIVLNGGYGYSPDTSPNVTITGPTGVDAFATIQGRIIGFAITNPGSNYTSPPNLTIVGGNGMNAQAIANNPINGQLSSISIPGQGTGTTATASIINGMISVTLTNSGSGWQFPPLVRFKGGNPSIPATGRTILNNNGGVESIILDSAGEGYQIGGTIPAVTVEFIPYTGVGYTSTPRIIVSGGGGSGATVEPIMEWYVSGISITNWGKCSWTGENSSVIIGTPDGGAPAIAELVPEPAQLLPTIVHQWRWRTIEPILSDWTYVGNENTETIIFPAPSTNNNPNYWLQTIQLPFTSIESQTVYEIEIPQHVFINNVESSISNIENGIIGTNTGIIRILNTIEGVNDINLKSINTKNIILDYITENNDELTVFLNPNGSVGSLSVTVNYHYTSGFELFKNDNPVITNSIGRGGDVFSWFSHRFENFDLIDNKFKPLNGWINTDKIFIDDGRSKQERATKWEANKAYEYGQLVEYSNKIYSSLIGGNETVLKPIIKNGKIYDVQIINKGTKYTRNPEIYITGDGSNAVLKSYLMPTKIHSVLVKNGGIGYTGNEVLHFISENGSGAQARIKTVLNGTIQEIELLVQGWNYDSTPELVIVGDTRTGSNKASFDVRMIPSFISRIEVINGGVDYTNANLDVEIVSPDLNEFIDNEWTLSEEKESKWKVFEFSSNTWNEIRQQVPQIKSSSILSADIFNKQTNKIEQELYLWDPYKGIIPGIIDKEIYYKLEYDPAIYTNGDSTRYSINENQSWNDTQIGRIWWDLSTVRYLNYEIDSLDYKWRNWGQLAPNVSIDVYEWIKTSIHPTDWNDSVIENRENSSTILNSTPTGSVDENNLRWVEKLEYNPIKNRMEPVYYYWVKNTTTISANNRKLSALQIANALENPSNNNIAWFAIIEPNVILINGMNSYIDNDNMSLQVKWITNEKLKSHHKEWKLLSEGDDTSAIDNTLWNKMRDSLVGWDDYYTNQTIFVKTLENLTSYSSTLKIDDASKLLPYGEVKYGDYWISYSWIYDNTLYGINSAFDIPAGSILEQSQYYSNPNVVPDVWLSEDEAYGSLIRPRQTWFKTDVDEYNHKIPSREARRNFVDTINNIFRKEPIIDTRYEWREIFVNSESIPLDLYYSYKVADLFYRNQLVTNNLILPGQRVLVEGFDESNGFWTVWKYEPNNIKSDTYGFILERAQKWRLQENELWETVDWYAEGWSKDDFPVRIFENKYQRDLAGQLDITLLKGTLVLVKQQDEYDSRWSWSLYTESGWVDVAKEKSTIQLKNNFYTSNILYGFRNFDISQISNRDGSWELWWIINQLQNSLLTNKERNELFFSMVHLAQSQHYMIDWMFKTSFLYLSGFSEELKQSPVLYSDQIENIISYIEEIKPYHVKIRDFVRHYSSPIDNGIFKVTDFDKPVYYDKSLSTFRKLDPSNLVDQTILSTSPYNDWYENFNKTNYDLDNWNEDWNPIRRINIKLLFDRVSCQTIKGWDILELPWDGTIEYYNGINTVTSFIELSSQYQKYSNISNEWNSFYSDYNVSIITPLILNIDGIEYIDINSSLNSVSIIPGQIVVIRNHTNFSHIHSVWRRISNTNNWEEFRYRNINVHDIVSRDQLNRLNQESISNGLGPTLQTGDVVKVSSTKQMFMWNGISWESFNNVSWDENGEGGSADRIEEYYSPELGMKQKNLCELISGCDYKGTRVDGYQLSEGIWDLFPWDFQGGLDNEFQYYVGYDTIVKDRPFIQGENSPSLETVYNPEDIWMNGDEYINPQMLDDHPEELIKIKVKDPFILTVYQTISPDSDLSTSRNNAFRMFKNSLNIWENFFLEEDNLVLDQNLDIDDDEIIIRCENTLELHDPQNRSVQYMDKIKERIKLNYTDMQLNEEVLNEIIANNVPGKVWINNELISYQEIEQLDEATFKLKQIHRGIGGTSFGILDDNIVAYYNSDGITSTYTIPNEWNGNNESIQVSILQEHQNILYWVNLSLDIHYSIQNNSIVLNTEVIPNPNSLFDNIRIMITRSNSLSSSNTHLANSKVYDASLFNVLPTNYSNFNKTENISNSIQRRIKWWEIMNDTNNKEGPAI